MKSIKYISIAFLLTISVQSFAKNKEKAIPADTVTYNMPLHGKHCENIIMKNIPYEKGVIKTKVDLDKQAVTVIFKKEKTNKSLLEKAFDKLGYKAIQVPSIKQ
ncbi:MAG: heavy-metal-associated domain-containing protein [Bacteroidales bacterium]